MTSAMLPAIPVIDARDGGPVAAAQLAERQMRALLDSARRTVPPPLFALSDRLSRDWLARSHNPCLDEIDAIAALVRSRGAYTLNTSYEWCCTCGVGDDPQGGVRLLRVLDWRQSGLGRALIVAWQRGPAGEFANIIWTGFVGAVAAMALGRFAAALNQLPMMSWGLSPPIDWLIGRCNVGRSTSLPPTHLLRLTCENCATDAEARQYLGATPVCLPAVFTLAGIKPSEGCVIERTKTHAARHVMPIAAGNHWIGPRQRGRPGGHRSRDRVAQMTAALAGDMPWLTPPIINRHTRLVAAMNPARGRLNLQGWEKDGPVTAQLTLSNT